MTAPHEGARPYLGLRPFGRDDAHLFFGRSAQAARLLTMLRESRFLPVIGSSGCGKSSLVMAGLLPRLLGGFLADDAAQWCVAILRPGDAPRRNLSRAVAAALGRADEDALTEALQEDRDVGLARWLTSAGLGTRHLLIVVDQFEEIFAYRESERAEDIDIDDLDVERKRLRAARREEAAAVVDLLLTISKQQALPVYVVLTMRTDFLGDCDVFFGLPEALNETRYLVPRLTRAELRQAIEGPAKLFDTRYAGRLLDQLLNELGDRFDRLPVLQHALLRTWEIWQDTGYGPIDLQHYEAAGGLADALARDADAALAEAGVATPKVTRFFQALTDTDTRERRVRRPLRRSVLRAAVPELSDGEFAQLLSSFGAQAHRSFVYERPDGQPNDPRIDIAHESLIRQWPRLRTWVDEEREARGTYWDLAARALRNELGRGALLVDEDLRNARAFLGTNRADALWAQRYERTDGDWDRTVAFITRSIASADAAIERAARQRRLIRRGALLAFCGMCGLTVWASIERFRSIRAEQSTRTLATLNAVEALLPTDPTTARLVAAEIDTQLVSHPRLAGALHRVATVPTASAVLDAGNALVENALMLPDGEAMIVADQSGRVTRWPLDAATGPADLVHLGRDVQNLPIAVRPNGHVLVAMPAQGDAGTDVYEFSGEQLRTKRFLRHDSARVILMMPSPDGRQVIVSRIDGSVSLAPPDLGNLRQILSPQGQRPERFPRRRATFAPDGRFAVVTNDTTRVFSADGRSILSKVAIPGQFQMHATFSPSGDTLLIVTSSGMLAVLTRNGERYAERGDLPLSYEAIRVEYAPNGRQFVTATRDGRVLVWDAVTLEPIAMLRHPLQVEGARFTRDSKGIVTWGIDGKVRLWPAPAQNRLSLGEFDGADIQPGTGHLLLRAGDRVRLLKRDGTRDSAADARLQAVLQRRPPADSIVTSALFSPDGARVLLNYATLRSDVVGVSRDGDTQGVVLSSTAQPSQVVTGAIHPDGRRLTLGLFGERHTVLEARVDSPGVQRSLWTHGHPVNVVSYSRDGANVLSAGQDGTVRISSTTGGATPPLVLGDPVQNIVTAAFDPTGRYVVTGTSDGLLRQHTLDGSTLTAVLDSGAPISAVRYIAPDTLAVLRLNGELTIYPTSLRHIMARIRRKSAACLTPAQRQSYLLESAETAAAKHAACAAPPAPLRGGA